MQIGSPFKPKFLGIQHENKSIYAERNLVSKNVESNKHSL